MNYFWTCNVLKYFNKYGSVVVQFIVHYIPVAPTICGCIMAPVSKSNASSKSERVIRAPSGGKCCLFRLSLQKCISIIFQIFYISSDFWIRSPFSVNTSSNVILILYGGLASFYVFHLCWTQCQHMFFDFFFVSTINGKFIFYQFLFVLQKSLCARFR